MTSDITKSMYVLRLRSLNRRKWEARRRDHQTLLTIYDFYFRAVDKSKSQADHFQQQCNLDVNTWLTGPKLHKCKGFHPPLFAASSSYERRVSGETERRGGKEEKKKRRKGEGFGCENGGEEREEEETDQRDMVSACRGERRKRRRKLKKKL